MKKNKNLVTFGEDGQLCDPFEMEKSTSLATLKKNAKQLSIIFDF